jgi:hypothetical protein
LYPILLAFGVPFVPSSLDGILGDLSPPFRSDFRHPGLNTLLAADPSHRKIIPFDHITR